MQLIPGMKGHGGMTATFPKMPEVLERTRDNRKASPWHASATSAEKFAYWQGVLRHLEVNHPGNRQGILKAHKMLTRVA